MIAITVKFLGGLRQEMGMASTVLSMVENSTVADLEQQLRLMGLDLDTNKNIVVLNQCGLSQWPPDRQIIVDDVVMVLPNISGGS